MKTYFAVPQPPLTKKYRLLIDDSSENGTFAITTDKDKVEYNRSVLNKLELNSDIDLQIQNALSDKGITGVVPLGRFITIIRVSKSEESQEMFFFDFESAMSFREANKEHLKGYFSDNIVSRFEDLKNTLYPYFKEEDDIIELIFTDEKL